MACKDSNEWKRTRRELLVHVGSSMAALGLSLMQGGENDTAMAISEHMHRSQLALELKRGITLDRQYWSVLPEPNFTSGDIRLIRAMGFGFVKLIINPAPHKSGNGLQAESMSYVDAVVRLVLDEGLPVVVCLHPEADFKQTFLGDPGRFSEYLDFMAVFARYLARRWRPEQLVFQLMTEPFGNTRDWNMLQPQIWATVRCEMPEHTLVLSGDQVATIEGLEKVEPVDDSNAYYCFEFYEPFIFTLQGFSRNTWWPLLGNVPYAASSEAVEKALPAILARIPADKEEWRKEVEDQVRVYGAEGWNAERLAARVRRVSQWSQKHGGGHHLLCGEFGIFAGNALPADRCAFLRDARLAFEGAGAGWAYWSYNEAFTVLKPGRTPWKPEHTPQPPHPDLVDQDVLEALGVTP